MRVTAFRLWNFMGFEDSGWIELRPIGLLFGRNSSGKSALLRALLLLRQSLDVPAEHGPFLWASEEGIDAGSFDSLVHCHDTDETLSFGFKCTVESKRLEHSSLHLDSAETEVAFVIGYGLDKETRRMYIQYVSLSLPSLASDLGDGPIIFETGSVPDTPDGRWFYSDFLQDHLLGTDEAPWNVWPSALVETDPYCGFFPTLALRESAVPNLGGGQSDYDYVRALLRVVKEPIEDFLRSLHYFGPLRSRPRRVYDLRGIVSDSTAESGLSVLAEYALRRRVAPQEQNDLSPDNQLANLGFKASLNVRFVAKIQQVLVELKRRAPKTKVGLLSEDVLEELYRQMDIPAFEITLTEANGIESNLCDVGFGISQILPFILAMAHGSQASVFVIEQPEVHLHPQAQAELGDLLINLANSGIGLLVETHSENLILRLRRRMAETALALQRGETRSLSIRPQMLAAYFVRRVEQTSTCNPVEYDAWGRYLQQPEGFSDFFSNDFDELLALDDARQAATEGSL